MSIAAGGFEIIKKRGNKKGKKDKGEGKSSAEISDSGHSGTKE